MTNNIFNLAYEKLKFNEKLVPISNNEDEMKLKKFKREEIFDPHYTLFKMALAESDFRLSYDLVYLLEREVFFLKISSEKNASNDLTSCDVNSTVLPDENTKLPVPLKLQSFNGDYNQICFINDYMIPLEHFPNGIPLFLEMLKDYFDGPLDKLANHPNFKKAAQAMRDDFEKCKDDPVLRKKMMDVDGYISIP